MCGRSTKRTAGHNPLGAAGLAVACACTGGGDRCGHPSEHRQTKQTETDRLLLYATAPAFDPTSVLVARSRRPVTA